MEPEIYSGTGAVSAVMQGLRTGMVMRELKPLFMVINSVETKRAGHTSTSIRIGFVYCIHLKKRTDEGAQTSRGDLEKDAHLFWKQTVEVVWTLNQEPGSLSEQVCQPAIRPKADPKCTKRPINTLLLPKQSIIWLTWCNWAAIQTSILLSFSLTIFMSPLCNNNVTASRLSSAQDHCDWFNKSK